MKLAIQCENENKNIDIDDNISIADLRVKIASLFERKPRNIDLQYGQVILLDSKFVKDYGITENSLIKIINQKIDLKVINKDSEVLLEQLDINMKVGDLKKKYDPANWGNLQFYSYYEFSVDNPNKKKVDMKVVDDKLNPKSVTTEQKKEELRNKYLLKYHGDRLYYFEFIYLNENEQTLAQHYMNDNYTIYITFQIFVKHSGSIYFFDVFDKLLISYFKELIKNKIDKSMLDFELIYNGETLKDCDVIGDYEINPNDTLITTATITGGV